MFAAFAIPIYLHDMSTTCIPCSLYECTSCCGHFLYVCFDTSYVCPFYPVHPHTPWPACKFQSWNHLQHENLPKISSTPFLGWLQKVIFSEQTGLNHNPPKKHVQVIDPCVFSRKNWHLRGSCEPLFEQWRCVQSEFETKNTLNIFERTDGERDLFANFTAKNPPKNQASWSLISQVSSWFPHLSAPQHLCHAIFERPVWFIVGGLWCCQWSSNGAYILDGSRHFLLYWSWSWIEVLCNHFFTHVLSIHKHINFIYTQTYIFCKKNSISALSRFKQTGVSFRSADLDPGSTPATAQFDQGFAGQFGHLLCRGEGGRSYGSQWQLALGTTKHGTLAFCDLVFSGWETSLTSLTPLFFWWLPLPKYGWIWIETSLCN